jgi:hypothetical protein
VAKPSRKIRISSEDGKTSSVRSTEEAKPPMHGVSGFFRWFRFTFGNWRGRLKN